jgi:hypothetical protein
MSELLQSGQHPDADQLSAFIEQALPAHEQEETLAHLAICPHCRSIVALSMPPAEELPVPTPARRPWLSGWIMVFPAGAALAALVLAGIYIRNGLVVEKHVTPMQTAQSTPPVPRKQLLPPTILELQAPPERAARETDRHSTAATPKTTSQSQAVDRLRALSRDGGKDFRFDQNGASAPLGGASAAQSSTVSIGTANQAFQTASPAVGLLDIDRARAVRVPHGLPSGLPALSTVASTRRVVAIDTHNTLFSSNDAGDHWNVVTQPWQGQAVKVELVQISYPASTAKRTVATAGPTGGSGLRDSVEAQRATLSGEITDPAGASVPNASVVVTNSVTRAVRRTTTDAAGRYNVGQLDPGTYTLEADAPGFTPGQISGLVLTPTQQTQKDLTLAVGSMAQTVEVEGEAQVKATAPVVKQQFPATGAAVSPGAGFQITTDKGEHWISTDGRSWTRRNE